MYKSGVAMQSPTHICMVSEKRKILFNCFIFLDVYVHDIGHWVATPDVVKSTSGNSEPANTHLTASADSYFPTYLIPTLEMALGDPHFLVV